MALANLESEQLRHAVEQEVKQLRAEAHDEVENYRKTETDQAIAEVKRMLDDARSKAKAEIREAHDQAVALVSKAKTEHDTTMKKKVEYAEQANYIRLEIEKLQEQKEEHLQQTEEALRIFDENRTRAQVATKERESLDSAVASLQAQSEQLKTSASALQNQMALTKKDLEQVELQKRETIREWEKIKQETDTLRDRSAIEINEMKAKAYNQAADLKKKESDSFAQLRIEEMARIEKLRTEAFDEIDRLREKYKQEIFARVEATLLPILKSEVERRAPPGSPPQVWMETMAKVKDVIYATVEEESFRLTGMAKVNESPLHIEVQTKRFKKGFIWATVGIVAIIAVTYKINPELILRFGRNLSSTNDRGETAAESMSRRQRDARSNIKFSPNKVEELKGSYTDCVLYTRDYTKFRKDTEADWMKLISTKFRDETKVDEDVLVQAVAKDLTIVETLQNKYDEVDTNFVEVGIRRMNDYEADAVEQLKTLLGSEANYKKYHLMFSEFFKARRKLLPPKASND